MERRVLFTASTYSHMINFHLPYLRRFHEDGWSVHIACGGAPVPVPYTDKTIQLPLQKSFFSLNNWRAAKLLRKQYRTVRYDLVVTHTSLAAFFSRLALFGVRNRPSVINMVHGYLFDDQTSLPKRMMLLAAERLTAPVTDLLLTMNRWDEQTAKHYQLGRRVAFVPGVGVDFSRFDAPPAACRQVQRQASHIPADAFVLIYAAEFSPRKSQAVLIRAMKCLPENFVLILAGSGQLKQDCQSLASSLNLSERVLFPGQIEDMASWYAMADAAVSASRSEGLPFNIMEAMYAGLPVIASDVKGHSDLIQNNTTGLLYPYGDEAACAEQIRRLADSRPLQEKIAAQAKENVMQYRLEKVFPIVWNEYESVL